MLVRRRKNKVRNSLDDRIYYVFCYAFCILLTLLVLYPLIYVVSCSFSSGTAVSNGQVVLWPVDATLEGYRRVVNYPGIWRAYLNTLFYTVGGTLLHVALVMTCAYPLARKGLPGKVPVTLYFSFTMLFGGGLIPGYLLIRNLGKIGRAHV